MVGVVLLVALATVQQQTPAIALQVDRRDVLTGDAIVLTLEVRASGDARTEIVNPALDGFEVTDQRDRSVVRIRDGAAQRETVRRITIRALRAGTFVIGPAVFRHGDRTVRSGSVEITVRARGEGAALAGRVRDFAASVPPPAIEADQVAVTVHTVTDAALVGAQVDLVAIAWFPRAVRERLRTPPTLRGPQVSGAWVYHLHVPGAPVLARTVGGASFDLYVLHDVLFPLRSGEIEIGPATVSFALPLSNALLSREVRHELSSRETTLRIRPLPAGVDQDLPVAGDLAWAVELPAGEIRHGDARVATVTVTGRGNVALWPEPEIAWPPGLRAYPEEAHTELESDGAGIRGSKMFRYLVVAESTGTHRVPALRYRYFDLGRRAAVSLEAPGIEMVTPGGLRTSPRIRAAPPLLVMSSASGPWADELAGRFGPWGWLAVGAFPPLLALWLRRRVPRRRWVGRAAPTPSTLSGLAREFRSVLRALVPDQALRDGDHLADALRAAGIEAPVAQHAVRVRDRLRQAVFGPSEVTDTDELVQEVNEVLRVMIGEVTRVRLAAQPLTMSALMVVCLTSAAAGQSATRLYETGAYGAAADSFYHRAVASPNDAAAWHNLGAALFQLDEQVAARAAWTRAARLSPRNRIVRDGLGRLGGPDRLSAKMLWVSPVTATEALLLGGTLWMLGWMLAAARTRRRVVLPILGLALAAVLYGAAVHERYADAVVLAERADAALLEAPYGSAPVVQRLPQSTAVRVLRERGGWLLVERGPQRGWVRASHVLAI